MKLLFYYQITCKLIIEFKWTFSNLLQTLPLIKWNILNNILSAEIYPIGNMWAQSWENIEEILRPSPDTPGLDVTDEMIKQVGNVIPKFENYSLQIFLN